ncbi:MAG: 2-oxoisovalerate dehydrogenase [Dehalococcoidia bacterium]
MPSGVEQVDSEIIFAVEESPDGGYEARALGFPIFTHADDLEELRVMVKDAVRCHFDDEARPSVIRLHLVRDEVIPA